MVRAARRSKPVKEAAAAFDLIIRLLEALDREREAFLPLSRHWEFHVAIQTIIKTLAYWRQQL